MFGGDPGGAGLVPTVFTWTHGGRRVHLCGSFTRWQETLPMSPVEGSPSVFQVVCTLPAGYHQYKFIVDGEWRHDDQLRVMSDPLGNVNNWVLVREPEMVPAAHTDMDHDMAGLAINNQRHPDQGQFLPQNIGLPEADAQAAAQITRQRIADFLLQYTAYDLLPESGQAVILDVLLPVKQAFHILYEQVYIQTYNLHPGRFCWNVHLEVVNAGRGIPAAPLWDSDRQQFVGMLSASDFITILRQLRNNGAVLAEEDFDTHTIAAWKIEKSQLAGMDGSLLTPRRPLLYVGPDDSLRQVTDRLLQNDVTFVPVLHYPHNGSVPALLHMASLSGVLKCICRHFRHVPATVPLLAQPIGHLPLGTWIPEINVHAGRTLHMLRPNTTLNNALELLLENGVSSLPVVDDHGSLIDIYSRSDITALARDRSYAHLQLDVVTVTQALQIGAQEWGNGPIAPRMGGTRLHMCVRSESLRTVMEVLAHPGVRRVICIEAGSNRVEGIISLKDVLNFLTVQ